MVFTQIFVSYESVQYKRIAFTFSLFNESLYGQTFPTNIKICAESMTSCLGYLQKVARANSPLLYMATWSTFNLGSCYFGYRRNPKLSRHQSRVPAATFSTMLVLKSVQLCSTVLWSYKIAHLVCIQRCVVTAKWILTSKKVVWSLNTVEKSNAGTLDRCLGNWGFPLYVKWQLSESMLHSRIYQWKIRSCRPSEVPRRDVMYSAWTP